MRSPARSIPHLDDGKEVEQSAAMTGNPETVYCPRIRDLQPRGFQRVRQVEFPLNHTWLPSRVVRQYRFTKMEKFNRALLP